MKVSGMDDMAPAPLVKKPRLVKHGGLDQGVRRGKGFSLGELKAVGLTPSQARKLGIYVDKRRKSVREGNIEALKDYLKRIKRV